MSRECSRAIHFSLLLTTLFVLLPTKNAAAFDGLSANVAVGQGILLSPNPVGAMDPTSFAIGAGYQFHELMRVDLEILTALRQRRGGDFDLQLRTSLVLDPFRWIYMRINMGLTQLITGPISYLLGLSIGTHLRPAEGLTFFFEAGAVVNQDERTSGKAELHGTAELRIGAFYDLPL